MEVSIYRLRTRDALTLCVLALLLLGVVMVQSASAGAAERSGWQWSANAIKDAVFAGAGILTFLAVGMFNYAWLGRVTANVSAESDCLAHVHHRAGQFAGAGSAYRGFREWGASMAAAGADADSTFGTRQVGRGFISGVFAGAAAAESGSILHRIPSAADSDRGALPASGDSGFRDGQC